MEWHEWRAPGEPGGESEQEARLGLGKNRVCKGHNLPRPQLVPGGRPSLLLPQSQQDCLLQWAELLPA